MNFGLSETALAAIRRVLARHPAVEEAVVYGSRALAGAHSHSDVDLVLCGDLPLLEAEGVALELDDLPIPVHFDVQAMNAIQHRGLREHIARVGQVLYSRSVGAAKPV